MSELLLGALALVLIFEGLVPFISPASWRRIFEKLTKLQDGQIRFLGLSCIVLGLALFAVSR